MKEKKEKAGNKPKSDEKDKKEPGKGNRDSNGRFTKGHAKEGGRKLGTPNRAGNLRDRLKQYLEPFIDNIPQMLVKVQQEDGTKEAMYLMEKYMPYFMPKYSSLAIGADQDRPMDEEQQLLELDARYTKKELSINFKTMIVVDNDALHDDDDPDDDPDFDLCQFETTED